MSKTVPFATTLAVRDACLCLALQRAARAMARRFDEALKPAGLTNQQFSLLMALNQPEPPTIAPVARLLGIDRTTLTAALKPLERRGWIRIAADAADRRNRRLCLTAAGHAALLAAIPAWERTQAELEAALGPRQREELRQGLEALSAPDASAVSRRAAAR